MKHTILKGNDVSVEVKIPKFSKGFLEHFLKFIIELKHRMLELNFNTNPLELCREFRAHVSDWLLSRFNLKHNELTSNGVNVPNALICSLIIKYVISRFS